MFAQTNFSVLVFLSFLVLQIWTKTITGMTCTATGSTTGACVPLDENRHSYDCRDVHGFLVTEVCEEQLGESYANVSLHEIQCLGF